MKHIVFDGIDGSGKSTLARAVLKALRDEGRQVLDVPTMWKEHGRYPTEREIADADVIWTAEPSTIWVGAGIRGALIRTGSGYSPVTIAHAFAVDREIHYRSVILPARAAGKTIIQDRSVSSSIAYQVDEPGGLSLADILALPGNALALEHSPQALVIATLSPDTAVSRLAARAGKNDESFYEKKEPLTRFAKHYASDWFRDIFTSRGTTIHAVSTETSQAESEAAAVALCRQLIN